MKNRLKNVSLDSLIYFHHIAVQRSLIRAAKILSVSPPAVTHSLNRLESALGVKLCVRGRREFRLTEEGKALLERTKIIVAQLDGFVDTLRDPQEFTGLLSVGMIDNFESPRLQRALNQTVDRFPKIRLNITIAGSEELTRLVSVGELDAAFGIFFTKNERLSYFPIGRTTTHYYITKRHPLSRKRRWQREDLFNQGLVWVDDKRRSRHELEASVFTDHPRYKMKFCAYTNQAAGALPILRSGLAIAPLSPTYIASLADSDDFIEIKVNTKTPDYREEGIFDPTAPLSAAARCLIGNLKKKLKYQNTPGTRR